MGSGFSNTDMSRNVILAVLLLLVGAAAGRCVRGNIVIRTTFSNGQLVSQETEGEESCEEEDHSDEDDEDEDDEEEDDDNDEDEYDDDDEDDNEDEDDEEKDDDEEDDDCECDDEDKSNERENPHRGFRNGNNTIKIRKVFQNGQLVEINREEVKICKKCRNQSLKMHDLMKLRYNCSRMSKRQQEAHLWCRGL